MLLDKGYEVHGIVRRSSTENFDRIAHLAGRITLHQADLLDQLSLIEVLREVQPDEVYNLAAMSFVPTSWKQPVLTGEFTAIGVTRVLEAIRLLDPQGHPLLPGLQQRDVRQGAGDAAEARRRRSTRAGPTAWPRSTATGSRSTTAKATACSAAAASCSTTKSPRRGLEFVTRKVTDGVARIKLGLAKELRLGNLEAKRDWGFAGDYVRAMWLMLQQDKPDDYVIATGETHTVQRAGRDGVRLRRSGLAEVRGAGPGADPAGRGRPADRRRRARRGASWAGSRR